jgi:hypothetical protein
MEALKKAVEAGMQKLHVYFPKKVNPGNIRRYKPFILAILLDPRLKIHHFERHEKLCFYEEVLSDVILLLSEAYDE